MAAFSRHRSRGDAGPAGRETQSCRGVVFPVSQQAVQLGLDGWNTVKHLPEGSERKAAPKASCHCYASRVLAGEQDHILACLKCRYVPILNSFKLKKGISCILIENKSRVGLLRVLLYVDDASLKGF